MIFSPRYRSFLEFESDMLLDIPALRAYLAEQLQPLFLAQDEKNRNSIFVELLEPIIKSGGAAEVVYHMVEPKVFKAIIFNEQIYIFNSFKN